MAVKIVNNCCMIFSIIVYTELGAIPNKQLTSYTTGRHNLWSDSGPLSFRFYISGKLAMGILGRIHLRRSNMATLLLLPRNIRPHDPEATSEKTPQRDRRRKHHRATRAREDRPQPHRYRRTVSSTAYDLLRTTCVVHLLVSELRMYVTPLSPFEPLTQD